MGDRGSAVQVSGEIIDLVLECLRHEAEPLELIDDREDRRGIQEDPASAMAGEQAMSSSAASSSTVSSFGPVVRCMAAPVSASYSLFRRDRRSSATSLSAIANR